MKSAPANVVALAEERAAAKASRDFARADHIRDELRKLGWEVTDLPTGFELAERKLTRYTALTELPDLDITTDITVGVIVDGWADDALRCMESILRHSSQTTIVALVIGEQEFQPPAGVIALHIDTHFGWGASSRRLIEISPSPLHVLIDPSTVFDGDALALLQQAIQGAVVAAGWRGALVNLDDEWRSVSDRGPGEVDVLLGYLMMVKRASILATDTPHQKAKYYRNADLELSLALRENGGQLVALDLPVHQERHHGYHDAEPEVRERESKRNYDRILARFRGREDILSPRR